MPGQPFSLANLRDTGEALYGQRWQAALARDLKVQPRLIQQWFAGKPLADLRQQLADLCRRCSAEDASMEKRARALARAA
jgi:hypothetical protein